MAESIPRPSHCFLLVYFEPLEQVGFKMVSLETALLSLTSVRCAGEIHALSVNQACEKLSPENRRVALCLRFWGHVLSLTWYLSIPHRSPQMSIGGCACSGHCVECEHYVSTRIKPRASGKVTSFSCPM